MSGIANRAILSIVLAVGILNAFIHSLAFADFSVYGCSSVYSLIRQRRLLEFLISPLILKSPSDIIQFLFIDLICLEMILSSLSFHSTSRKKDVSDWSWDNSNNNSGNSNRRYSSKQHRLLQHLLVPKVNNVWKSLPVLIMLMLWSFVTVSVFRIILGLLFFRSTGWSMPQLFFHSSHYECLNGLFYYQLPLFLAVCPQRENRFKFGVHLTLSVLSTWLLGGVKIWSLAAACLTAWVFWMPVRVYLLRIRQQLSFTGNLLPWTLLLALLAFSAIKASQFNWNPMEWTRLQSQPPQLFAQMYKEHQPLISLTFVTAPRSHNDTFLIDTLRTYLPYTLPQSPLDAALYGRLETVVFTHFDNHPVFSQAKETFQDYHQITWIQKQWDRSHDQSKHFAAALRESLKRWPNAYYVMLIEDDFPLCEGYGWSMLMETLVDAQKRSHCGVFVGTGGSGLLIRNPIAKLLVNILVKEDYHGVMPTDIIIQQCLLGMLKECFMCANGQGMIVSPLMVMRHAGFNSSTTADRSYRSDEFQCHWRHPFNWHPLVYAAASAATG